ncbi:hypothetical protein H1V43_11405 [Streptomyces sp. PSKA54]|uniref:UL36 very large tegument protein n=1 Tax=Streptomyces himalayensis subsp. aureolus TaxID=2758039 RepID=A0A7W2CZL2_9ACTN|nr:hypothetical protein [Streptomyces himalayensis]MBA4861984.1 hypothetical protein [Streptomyces himalayensis subsp. aureolus]
MTVEQLPDQVREFAAYLRRLVTQLDQDAGWCAVFWQCDPEGMQACLDGREVPPWDVVESLIQDLAADRGDWVAGPETVQARSLHAASLAAYDARPGGREALGDRLDVMLSEQRYAAERQAELGELLRDAASPDEAEGFRLDLAWARDDHERATARCAELRSRIATVDRLWNGAEAFTRDGQEVRGRPGAPDDPTAWQHPAAPVGTTGPGQPGQGHSVAAGRTIAPDDWFRPEDEAPATGGPSGAAGRQAQRREGPAHPSAGAPGPGVAGRAAAGGYGGAAGGGSASDAGQYAPGGTGNGHSSAEGYGLGATGGDRTSVGDYWSGVAGGDSASAGGYRSGVSGGGPASAAGYRPGVTGGEPTPAAGYRPGVAGGDPASAAGYRPGVAGGDPASAGGYRPGVTGDDPTPAPGYRPGTPAGGSAPSATRDTGHDPAARSANRASETREAETGEAEPRKAEGRKAKAEARAKRRRGSARFAGIEAEPDTALAEPAMPVPVMPAPAATVGTRRGARFAGAPEDSEGTRQRQSLDAEARRAVTAAVERLVRLRAEGRSGEAHAVLVEAAYWAPTRFPLLAAELHRAGLGADWATLLWEAASLPPDRLVAAADALSAAGRTSDSDQILRQGLVRPAPEIGDAVVGLVDEGRHREARVLLDVYVRVRTPEEVARCAQSDPERLVPLLLDAVKAVSDERHWDVVHALRVAGLA